MRKRVTHAPPPVDDTAAIAPGHVLYNPQKGPVFAPVKNDLAAPAAGDAGALTGGGL